MIGHPQKVEWLGYLRARVVHQGQAFVLAATYRQTRDPFSGRRRYEPIITSRRAFVAGQPPVGLWAEPVQVWESGAQYALPGFGKPQYDARRALMRFLYPADQLATTRPQS